MIDEISLKILKILQEKARIPNVEVARQVNMAPSAVLERVRKLEKQGIIDGYEVILNPKQLKRDLVAFIRVYPTTPANSSTIGEALAQISEIQEAHLITGADCFLVKARVGDVSALGELLDKKISTIEGVSRTQTSVALSTLKETSRIPLDSIEIEKRQ